MAEEATSTPTESTSGGETTTTEAATESTWSYADGVAGSGDAPEWFKAGKYNSVSDQAKAYGELETKLGGFTGAPEQYALADGLDIDTSNPLFDGFAEIGKKYNMNNDMYNEVLSLYAKTNAEQQEAFIAQQRAELGENGEARLNNLKDWVTANIPEGLREQVVNWSQTAKDVEALEALVGLTKGQKIASPDKVNTAPEFTEEGLHKLQFEQDDYGRRRMSTDPKHRAKVHAYMEELMKLG